MSEYHEDEKISGIGCAIVPARRRIATLIISKCA